MTKKKAKQIVITGGPCSGKTTSLSYLAQKLMDRGFRVFLVPEVATTFITGGVPDIATLATSDIPRYVDVQKQILMTQIGLRRHFNDMADVFGDEQCVILFDRADMDNVAYLPSTDYFDVFMEEERLTWHDVRDSYDGVIHLVTAANGAEEFYTHENNEARYETPEQARIQDTKTINAWTGHPHLRIIDNSTDFEEKMRRTLKAVSRILGIPVPIEIERKYLLAKRPNLNIKAFQNSPEICIEQVYLISKEGRQLRARKRSQGDSASYFEGEKGAELSPGVRPETENPIGIREYLHLVTLKDPATSIVKKNRYCFTYKNQYFELDIFTEPREVRGLCLLEIELTEEHDEVELPPFLQIEREVTDDPAYTNHEIAKGR